MANEKYLAFKLRHLDFWVWFKEADVTVDGGRYTGKSGWGLNGNYIYEMEFKEVQVEGKMTTATPMYKN